MVMARAGRKKRQNKTSDVPASPTERTNNLQWTLLFDRLSETVNCIYQLCEKTHNEMSCKVGTVLRDYYLDAFLDLFEKK